MTDDDLKLAGMLVGWIVSLLVLSWRSSKWVNGVGERVNELKTGAAQREARVLELERRMDRTEGAIVDIRQQLGRQEQQLDGLGEQSTEHQVVILSAINDARREASGEAGMIRERLAALEAKADVAAAIERAVTRIVERDE